MKDTPEFNIHFVSLIKENPVLYDYNNSGYSNRYLQEKTWEKIGDDVNESVQTCKERWKNLRGSYTKHLKYVKSHAGYAKKKRPYYLAEYLTFLLPFTKTRAVKSNIVNPLADVDNSDCEFDNNGDVSITQYEKQLESEFHLPLSPYLDHDHDSSAPMSDTSTSAKILKRFRENSNKSETTLEDVKTSALEYFHQNAFSIHQKYEDPDVSFLMSVLPDLKKMNDNQKRRFKIEILTSAGRILDETINLDHHPLVKTIQEH